MDRNLNLNLNPNPNLHPEISTSESQLPRLESCTSLEQQDISIVIRDERVIVSFGNFNIARLLVLFSLSSVPISGHQLGSHIAHNSKRGWNKNHQV